MTIDYEQLRLFVKEAMFTGGGINTPSAPEGIPHRMPAANPPQETGTPEANALYDLALVAREATEELVAALEDPTYDDAYENAFKASACLRRALNNLIEGGAHPTPDQRVVAPPKWEQPFNAGGGDYGGGAGYIGGFVGDGGLEEASIDTTKPLPDVERVTATMKRAPGLDKGLAKIDTRPELEQHLLGIVKAAAANVAPNDVITALTKILAQTKEGA
jgi:hypothetical protein